MTSIAPQPYRSFGNYLTLADAVVLVGAACVNGWRKNDPDASNEGAIQRYADAVQRLTMWLTGAEVSAWTTDDEGAWVPIDRTSASKPYFDIDVKRSAFKYAPDDWAAMFIDRTSLTTHLNSITKAKPRTNSFRWQQVSAIAWKEALDMQHPRERQPLLIRIQLRCDRELNFEPGEKELGPVVDDIIRHLEGRNLSRDV
ncbi:hypothetical protein [Pseudonocardia sp. TMWB2A]|uniref:hypothetical protein n=1 Tax=Pseudonocardia sp. TMWB2A TaxID=687430 RepID=UPI00307D6440